VEQPESIAQEAFWLKKVKTLSSYGFTTGVTLLFDRASNFNLAVEESRSKTPSPATGRLNLSGENDKVKFLTKGRFTRDQAAKEIVTTEQTYVEQLKVLLDHFVEPTLEKKLVEDSDITKMLKSIRLIHGLHEELLREMEERIKNMSSATQLGDLFLKLMPFMKVYGEYCLNYESNVNKLFAIADEDKTLCAWIKEVEAKEEFALNNVGAYLIVPVQRIPRYRLLFEQLLKLTPDSHPDCDKLKETLEKVNEIATFVNNYQDDSRKLQEVRDRIENCAIPVICPGRKFIHEGIMKKTSSRATQERMFFLFSDVLIYCTPKEPHKYKGHIPLNASSWIKGLSDTKVKNGMQLVAESKTYTLVSLSPEDKYQWNRMISSVLADLNAASPRTEKNKVNVKDRGGIWRILTKTDKLNKY